jgi:hypothetical protein
MMAARGTYRIVGGTYRISRIKIKQIADILGIKDINRFKTVTIEFIEQDAKPKEKGE